MCDKAEIMIIEQVDIRGIWNGTADIIWEKVDPQVNILVGNNGSGKSTLLNILHYMLVKDTKSLKEQVESIIIKFARGNGAEYSSVTKNISNSFETPLRVSYVNTFDIPSSKKSAHSQLTQQLDTLLYQRQKDVYSFTDYRLEMLNENAGNAGASCIEELFDVINSMFSTSGKTIDIKRNEVVFDKKGQLLNIDKLSSGEKQLLILLFSVFLMKRRSAVLLLDEPEISLHMAWQDKLLENLLKLNPNCQIILTTHSPNIFADGWGDKLVFMGNILKEK